MSIFDPSAGQTHLQQSDGSVYFPSSRFTYVEMADRHGWSCATKLLEMDTLALADPCALSGHLHEEQDSVSNAADELLCSACSLAIADNPTLALIGRRVFDEPHEKTPASPAFGSVLHTQVYKHNQYPCRYCGAKQDLMPDHLVSVVRGDKNTLELLATAYSSCKNAQTPAEVGKTLRPVEGGRA